MPEGILPDYSRQAQTYDQTRGASRSVVAALRGAIDEAPGRRLADIGGGTGNYALALAELGWVPLVIDRSPNMLQQAAAKGLETLLADAEQLPLADASFDAAVMVSMLHHVDNPQAALVEEGASPERLPGGEDVQQGGRREPLADLVLEERWRTQTSYFERLERDHSDELNAGLQRLADDLDKGRVPDRESGSATLIAWQKP